MHYSRFSYCLLLVAFAVEPATAQGPPFSAAGSNMDSGVAAGLIHRPILITGRVKTSSGETPPEPVTIRRDCDADTFVEGYTSSDGRFSFEVGNNGRFAVMDAATDGPLTGVPQGNVSVFNTVPDTVPNRVGLGVDLSHCRLTAELPGYRSTSIQLARRRSMDRPEVGTLILTPLREPSDLVSATSLAAPKAARKALERGVEEINRGAKANLRKAIALLEKAVAKHPPYAAAWAVLGETKRRMGDVEGAVAAFERAIEADPRYLRPYQPLVLISAEQKKWGRTVELSETALQLDPTNIVLRWLNAVGQYELGREDKALAAIARVESDPDASEHFPETHRMRGLIYAQRGDFVAAAAELRRFLEAAPDSPEAKETKRTLKEWKALGVV